MNFLKVLSNPQEALTEMASGKMEDMLGGLNLEPSLILSAVQHMLVTAVLQEALRREPTQAYLDQMAVAGYSKEDAFSLWAMVLKEAVVQ